jgi:hypothetical protein
LYLNPQKAVRVTKNRVSEIRDPRFICISINGKRADKKEGGCAILGVKFTKKMEMEAEMLGYKSVTFLLYIVHVQCFLNKKM